MCGGWGFRHARDMTRDDQLLFATTGRGLQACFQALTELARDLSEPRRQGVSCITQRVQRAKAELDVLIDERRG